MQRDIPQKILAQLHSAGLSDELRGVFLVGSQARDEARPYSDIDVLALTHEQEDVLYLFPRRELAVVHLYPLEYYLQRLYAPNGRLEVLEWFLIAGNVQVAKPWHDPGSILPVMQRMVQQRLPLLQLQRRIYWDEQMQQLSNWRQKLAEATPHTHEFYWALARFLGRVPDALILYHGKVMPRFKVTDLYRPDEYDDLYARLWLLGATPDQVDTGQVADTISRIVKGIWQAVADQYVKAHGLAERDARQQAVDRIPGQAATLDLPQETIDALVERIDRYLEILWAAVKHMLGREPVLVVRHASMLMECLHQDGLSTHPQIAPLLHEMRLPPGANPKVVPYLAEELEKAIRKMNNRGA